MEHIGFGGSCHWCTEAIFMSLNGVVQVEQGWISPGENDIEFSEAVIVSFDHEIISLQTLIAIHLHTHSCTSSHNMRTKYRSAVYTFNKEQKTVACYTIKALQREFDQAIITKVVAFGKFKLNAGNYLNYYYSNPKKPFCKNVISPKLRLLLNRFQKEVDHTRIGHADFSNAVI